VHTQKRQQRLLMPSNVRRRSTSPTLTTSHFAATRRMSHRGTKTMVWGGVGGLEGSLTSLGHVARAYFGGRGRQKYTIYSTSPDTPRNKTPPRKRERGDARQHCTVKRQSFTKNVICAAVGPRAVQSLAKDEKKMCGFQRRGRHLYSIGYGFCFVQATTSRDVQTFSYVMGSGHVRLATRTTSMGRVPCGSR